MTIQEDILALVRDLAREETISYCCDRGPYCAFCHQEPKGAWEEIKHDPDCLWERAVGLVKRIDEENKK